jgi:hypothetical protein
VAITLTLTAFSYARQIGTLFWIYEDAFDYAATSAAKYTVCSNANADGVASLAWA